MNHPVHPLSHTTHTIEMSQLAQLNERLGSTVITVAELVADGSGLVSARSAGGRLPDTAVLIRVDWDGDPTFPSIHARFAAEAGGQAAWRVDAHTAFLLALDRRLALRQRWGLTYRHPGQASSLR